MVAESFDWIQVSRLKVSGVVEDNSASGVRGFWMLGFLFIPEALCKLEKVSGDLKLGIDPIC